MYEQGADMSNAHCAIEIPLRAFSESQDEKAKFIVLVLFHIVGGFGEDGRELFYDKEHRRLLWKGSEAEVWLALNTLEARTWTDPRFAKYRENLRLQFFILQVLRERFEEFDTIAGSFLDKVGTLKMLSDVS